MATRTAQGMAAAKQTVDDTQSMLTDQWQGFNGGDIAANADALWSATARRADSLRAESELSWQGMASSQLRSDAEASAQAAIEQAFDTQANAQSLWQEFTSTPEILTAQVRFQQASERVVSNVGLSLWSQVEQNVDALVYDTVQEMVQEALLASSELPTPEMIAEYALIISERAARRAVDMTIAELIDSTLDISVEEWADILVVAAVHAAEQAATELIENLIIAYGAGFLTGNPVVVTALVGITLNEFTNQLLRQIVAEAIIEITQAEH